MAIYPGAYYAPISKWEQPGNIRSTFNKAILHTAVSNSRSLEGQFRDEAVCSHFYVDVDGNVEQYMDTKYKSAADYEGNSSSISIETWDGWGSWAGLANPYINATPWNAAQVIALGKLVKWICTTHNIPITQMTNSLPGSRGVGIHRLGISPWRVDGGEQWSTSNGKICPGTARVNQHADVVQQALLTDPWSGRPPLRVDGGLGPATIKRWQEIMGTPIDGSTIPPVSLVKAVQQRLNLAGFNLVVDGYGIRQGTGVPTETVRALQEYLGARPAFEGPPPVWDGLLDSPVSTGVNALQSRLNKGFF